MKLVKAADYKDACLIAAGLICQQIHDKPNSVLGLATGGSPIGIYKNLVAQYQAGLDFSQVHTVNLDEYFGLPSQHPQSYAYYMANHLFNHINIPTDNIHIPDGTDPNSQSQCDAYDRVISSLGGMDLQLLGIGHNGHIGFNEPSTSFSQATHLVALTDSTIAANARFFAQAADVPRYAYTMGIEQIMQSKKILMIVTGEDKARILYDACFGPVTPALPASILQLHRDFTLVADENALKYFSKNSP